MTRHTPPSGEPNPELSLEAIIQRGIFEIETNAAEIADLAHPTSSVRIEIEQHHPITGILPEELVAYFERQDIPATAISSVNVSADYENSERHFRPNRTEIVLNEGTSLEFSQSPTLARMGLYHFQMLKQPNPDDARPKLPSKSSVVTVSEFQDTMARMQLDIPVGNGLDLSSITKALQFTEKWRVKLTKNITLSPQQLVRIEDTYFRGVRNEGKIAFGYTPEQSWSRALKIGVEEPLAGFSIPTSSTQLILLSQEPNAIPRLSRILDIPVSYAPEEDDLLLSAFVEHPLRRRVEDIDQSCKVEPTIPLLTGFYSILQTVREALEKELPLE